MKLLTYILLLHFIIGACIPKSDFSQLAKISNLLEHYEIHQKEALRMNVSISFMGFMYVHFFSDQEHEHSDKSAHNKLPLKSFNSLLILFSIFSKYTRNFDINSNIETLNVVNNSLETQDYQPSIFHPPAYLIA